MKKRFSHIDILKAIAMFFVVFYHIRLYYFDFIINKDSSCIYYVRYLLWAIVSSCVPLFFFTNGYLLFSKTFSYEKHLRTTMRLTVLTLTGLVLCPAYMIINGVPVRFKDILLYWLNMDKSWSMNRYWFIGALVCIYIFFPALKSLYDHDEKSFCSLVIILFLLTFGIKLVNTILAIANSYVGTLPDKINYAMIDMFVPIKRYGYSFVYFCVGGIAVKHEGIILKVPKRKRNIIALTIIAVSCITLFAIGIVYSMVITHNPWDIVWEGFDSLPTFLNVIAMYILALSNNGRNYFVEHVSKNTLWVYLIHGLVIRITQPVIKKIPFNQTLSIRAVYALSIVFLSVVIIDLTRYKICGIKKKRVMHDN